MLVYLHIIMGLFALTSGVIAFSSRKGASLHKKSGLIFVITMLIMSSTGAFLAALAGEKLNIVAGCLTFYLVATAFLVVH
ncbi:MAG: putative membrane protein, partial [Arenicella sp.]